MGLGIDVKLSPLILLANYLTPLGIGVTYPPALTTTKKTVSGYNRIVGTVRADVAGTLFIYQMPTPTAQIFISTFPVAAGVTTAFSVEVVAPLWDWQYTNGAGAQALFEIYIWGKTIG